MPQFSTDPPNLDDPEVNAQRAAFIAVLGNFEHGWASRTSSIAGFATVLRDKENEFDDEARDEFLAIIQGDTQQLRPAALELQWASRLLCGTPIPYFITPLNVREIVDLAANPKSTTPTGDTARVVWTETAPHLDCDEGHFFVIVSALIKHGSRLAFNRIFDIAIRCEDDYVVFIFSGNMTPAFFTDPTLWFTINEKQGSDSLGLFVARELARLYGGDVWMETADKTRFDFRLRLPVAPKDAPDE